MVWMSGVGVCGDLLDIYCMFILSFDGVRGHVEVLHSILSAFGVNIECFK